MEKFTKYLQIFSENHLKQMINKKKSYDGITRQWTLNKDLMNIFAKQYIPLGPKFNLLKASWSQQNNFSNQILMTDVTLDSFTINALLKYFHQYFQLHIRIGLKESMVSTILAKLCFQVILKQESTRHFSVEFIFMRLYNIADKTGCSNLCLKGFF